jgi:hypothetical protein
VPIDMTDIENDCMDFTKEIYTKQRSDIKMSDIFTPFPKMGRLNRDVVVTEKIDGTNASIYIDEAGTFKTGSRNRWITPEDDNYGFSRWAHEHKDELMKLGPGHHFGEWWGQGIQRKYGLTEKRFSLFNVSRWCEHNAEPKIIKINQKTKEPEYQICLPECVRVVPILWEGDFCNLIAEKVLYKLGLTGSIAAEGFTNPEGIVIFHTSNGVCYKMTFDDRHKSCLIA